jgi:hypothetical protein
VGVRVYSGLLATRATLWVSGGVITLSTLPVHRALRGIRDVEELLEPAKSA